MDKKINSIQLELQKEKTQERKKWSLKKKILVSFLSLMFTDTQFHLNFTLKI